MFPGDIVEYDYRPTTKTSNDPIALKVLQWNVERNYSKRSLPLSKANNMRTEAEAIMATIHDLDPDVIILQEVDIDCKRSGNRNHMKELCKHLGLKGGFVCEFLELDSPIRRPNDEGGGFHGNAILSKFDVEFRVVHHQRHSFDWERDGERLREPRKGRRFTLVGKVRTASLPPVLFYCVHLEVFTGIIGRITSFAEIFQDAAKHMAETPHQAIIGDMNTMAHSIARLSPVYARDRYRFLSIGKTESAWWDHNLLDFHWDDGPINTRLACASLPFYPRCLATCLAQWVNGGFDADVLQMARNPGFYDPWDPELVTLHNPRYLGLFKGKLDWTLLRCLNVVDKRLGNIDYSASDHAFLMLSITPDNLRSVSPKTHYAKWRARRAHYNTPSQTWSKVYAVAMMLIFAIGIRMIHPKWWPSI